MGRDWHNNGCLEEYEMMEGEGGHLTGLSEQTSLRGSFPSVSQTGCGRIRFCRRCCCLSSKSACQSFYHSVWSSWCHSSTSGVMLETKAWYQCAVIHTHPANNHLWGKCLTYYLPKRKGDMTHTHFNYSNFRSLKNMSNMTAMKSFSIKSNLRFQGTVLA